MRRTRRALTLTALTVLAMLLPAAAAMASRTIW